MEKWSNERFEQYLQQLQTGELAEPMRDVLQKLQEQFHSLYDDYIIEEGEAREAKKAEFERSTTVYFQLGHALVMQLLVQDQEPAKMDQSDEQKGGANPDEQQEQQPDNKKAGSLDWSDEEMPKLVPIQRKNPDNAQPGPSRENAAAPPKEREIPYEQMVTILKPILGLPVVNVVTETLIQEIILKSQLVYENAAARGYVLGNESKMVIAIIESKMDFQSRAMWNWELAESRQEPTIDMLVGFLLKRANRLMPEERGAEALQYRQEEMQGANAMQFDRAVGPMPMYRPEERAAGAMQMYRPEERGAAQMQMHRQMEDGERNHCAFCKRAHKMCKCIGFKSLNLRGRWDVLDS